MDEPAKPGRIGVGLTALDMARARTIAAGPRKGPRRNPLLLGGRKLAHVFAAVGPAAFIILAGRAVPVRQRRYFTLHNFPAAST